MCPHILFNAVTIEDPVSFRKRIIAFILIAQAKLANGRPLSHIPGFSPPHSILPIGNFPVFTLYI